MSLTIYLFILFIACLMAIGYGRMERNKVMLVIASIGLSALVLFFIFLVFILIPAM